ncbi:MAG TPA: aspartate aminotransferase family protein, partial [Bradyrhizobium sp.]|nr:aspartate aminotransferase family protein [Bradyrhizobium sp.]
MTESATSHLLPVFARVDLAFERGEGAWLTATDGERYLDFTSGVAVNALGHAHPHLVAALQAQATKLWHMSNLFKSPDGERLAARLCEQSFADFVFFANSGAEAMECAIKVTRKYHAAKNHPERYRIVTFDGAFHGRTLATLAATGSAKYLDGFGPPMDGFDQVPLGDLEAVKRAIGPHTAGILIEPLQGEGGVRAAPHAFFKALRQLCDDNGLLLIFDEVQTGMGRTGELFAHKRLGVTPDVMPLAKALGGGQTRADRKSAAQCLGERHHVRRHAEALVGEEIAGAAHAGLHFVERQQQAVLVAQLAQRLEECVRRRAHAALALHGLDQDAGGLRADRLLHGFEIAVRHLVKTVHRRAETFEIFCRAGGGERRQRAAVEGALERDDAVALRSAARRLILARDLDGTLHRLGTGIAEEHG